MRLHWLTLFGDADRGPEDGASWDGPASELGMTSPASSGGGAAPAAAPASTETTPTTTATPSKEGGAPAEGEHSVAAQDDEEPGDVLDILSTPEGAEPPEGSPEAGPAPLRRKMRKLEKSLKKLYKENLSLQQKAQQWDSIDQAFQTNPRLRSMFFGDGPAAAPVPEPQAPQVLRPEDYPFDITDPSGKFFADWHAQSQRTMQALVDRLNAIESRFSSQSREATKQEWQTVAKAAAEKLPEEYRELFMNAIGAEMLANLRGEYRSTPQAAVDRYLNRIAVSTQTKTRASDAAAERMARFNQQQPRQGSPTASPAGARSTRPLRLSELNKRVRTFGG